MGLPQKTKNCSICKKRGYTEWHHIISQHHAKKTGQDDLITNPDNLIELCKRCHDQTTASMVRKRLTKQGKPLKKATTRKKTAQHTRVRQTSKSVVIDRQNRKNEQNQIVETSLETLELRGVLIQNTPRLRITLEKYLLAVKTEDELAEKWSEYFTTKRLQNLYPEDHWLHNSDIFDEEKSHDFENDGFYWLKNGRAWISELSVEKANYNINLANIRNEQRSVVEQLQNVAATEHEQRRMKDLENISIECLQSRNVYDDQSPVNNFNQLYSYLQQVSVNDEIAKKWFDYFSIHRSNHLQQLYPEDHWLHNKENFDKILSKEFEEDGYCWTSKGGAWKHNLSMKQTKIEIQLANIRMKERNLIAQEEKREKVESDRKEELEHTENSIIDMVERNVYDPNAPVKGNARNLISYIDGMKTESEIYRNWADYFSENRSRPLLKLYPTDHWMHSSSQFNKNLSQQFEKDGFCWTPNGGAWKIGLTLEVAKAEVDLAKAKSR